MKKYIYILFAFITAFASCKKFTDIVPDNIATIDNAFNSTYEAQRFLNTCYSFLPQEGHPETNPAFNAGDEFWIYWPISGEDYGTLEPYEIARGVQTKVNPRMNYWDGFDNTSLWQGIRDCNIMLENIDKVPELPSGLKKRWIAEAKFLKAYFHWYLFRMYGPIPIVDKNLPITASVAEVRVMQQPVDSVVNYIANLLNEAASGSDGDGLPNKITNEGTELGRITRPAVLALKARLLVTAASPLFNGNTEMSGFKNKAGAILFNQTYNAAKWDAAVAACKTAIDAATAVGIKLFNFDPGPTIISPEIKLEMSIRGTVTERWNTELIWGSTIKPNATEILEAYACPQLERDFYSFAEKGQMAPTMKMAELFYSKNGVPINEDKTWDYVNRYKTKMSAPDEIYLKGNYETALLHFDREPRFYADLSFDGAKFYMKNKSNPIEIEAKAGQFAGKKQSRLFSVTGYTPKKLVNYSFVSTQSQFSVERYPWPVMRLGDLYLLYAEALNETGKSTEAISWLDKIRQRAGLQDVAQSWTSFSTNPSKYSSKDGLRNIIHQERLIEMAFEGSRFWDIRRWKEASGIMNAQVYGWDVSKAATVDYYRPIILYTQRFVSPRDYFWPIKENNITVNNNLVQNPGW